MNFKTSTPLSLGLFAFLAGFTFADPAEEKLALADAPASETKDVAAASAPAPTFNQISDKVKDQKLRKHLVDNIDIFGKSEMPAIYIFAPGVEEMEGFLLTRDFSRDDFFMQNIDREEFEMKTSLRDFEEEKKGRKKDEEGR